MNIKRVLSMSIVLVLLIAYSTPAFSDKEQSYPISKNDAWKKAQEFLEKNLNLKINENDLQLCYDYPIKSNTNLCWKLSTAIKENDKITYLNVYIDSVTGKVLSIRVKGDEQEPNEVIYHQNFIKVSIDKITEQVTYYEWDWDDNIDFLFGKEHAEETARSFLKNYYDFEDESITIEFDYDSPIENHFYNDDIGWEMTANIEDGDKSYYSFICVSAFIGEVVYITIDDETPWTERKITTRTSKDEARTIAEDFLKKVAPDKFKETVFMGEYNTPPEGGAAFHFARFANGVVYDQNFLELSVDVSNGKIRFYGCMWDKDIVFPNAEDIITEEEAIKIAGDELKLFYYNLYKTNETELIYRFPEEFNDTIDPRMDYDSILEEKVKKRFKDITAAEKKDMLKNMSKNIKNSTEIIESEIALQAINKYLKVLYDTKLEITDLRYVTSEYSDEKIWTAHFENIDTENELNGEIHINALDGELIRVRRDNYIDLNLQGYIKEEGIIDAEVIDEIDIRSFKSSLTWEDGYDKAIDAISEIYPDKINNIKTKIEYCESNSLGFRKSYSGYNTKLCKVNSLGGYYSYEFPRIENELPIIYSDEGICIDIDSEGRILEVNYEWNHDLKFSKPDNLINKEDAKKKFFEKYKPMLIYEKLDNQLSKDGFKLKLLYRFPYEVRNDKIDALTGNFIE